MNNLLILGAGKIGSLITYLLAKTGDYNIYLADVDFSSLDHSRSKTFLSNVHLITLDVNDKLSMEGFLKAHTLDAIASCLPYHCNIAVAQAARDFDLCYFDLTEDTTVTEAIKRIANGSRGAFVPQCGLAPGFVGIVAESLMRNFETVDTVKMRVGALPVNTSNALHYSLTWSTDGLVNEYSNLCHAIEGSQWINLPPMREVETIEVDGLCYEAFTTSGGLGSLAELYLGKVRVMNYKTIRYPGHCEKMNFLLSDLKLKDDRETLKRILENAIPKTYQDVVIIYVSVMGEKQGVLMEESYVKKIYPKKIAGLEWSAIQVTTSAGLCAVIDIILRDRDRYVGFVYQEKIPLDEFLANPFGQYYH